MGEIGTPERPLRIAIVGAGPSGFYAAAPLLSSGKSVQVDLLDRLPTPFGLVRGGVAPDHQNIKAVVRAYDKTAQQQGFRFLGNVRVGVEVTIPELLQAYDQVVMATGCESANALGVPGEELPGSHSATEFVGWYNGHPDHVHRTFDLSARAAVVVGVGNVAMDVTRLLLRDRESLGKTDIAAHALQALARSNVTEVHVLGRRGPLQVAFTAGELEEIAELPDVDVIVDPQDLVLDDAARASLEGAEKAVKQNYELLQTLAARPPTHSKRMVLRLLTSPIAIRGDDRVTAIEVGRNELVAANGEIKARDTGARQVIEAGLVFRAVGYRGIPIVGCPYDPRTGTIPNDGGRVRGPDGTIHRLYVVGWAKRGPQGLIGTNRADSRDTVDRMVEDWTGLPIEARTPIPVLEEHAVSWEEWRKLDAAEVDRGREAEKLREKFVSIDDMLAHLGRR